MTRYLKRKAEADIDNWISHDPDHPLLVRGARRTGKTRVIEETGKARFGSGFVKLDFQTELASVSRFFDGPTDDVDRIVRDIADRRRIELDPNSTLLFFDEVQLDERALNSLRFFAGSRWRVIASGSLLGVSTGKRKLPFPSGVRQLELHPMDFEEYLWAMGESQMAQSIRSHAENLEPYALHGEAMAYWNRYLTLGGMPKVLSTYLESGSMEEARQEQREIDQTYTADMTDPTNGISGISAQRIWNSLPSQLLRASTKKFKYSEVVRGGRRQRLLEPLEWLAAAGIVTVNDLTRQTEAPLVAYDETEGSFFKVYVADTGLMCYKLGIDPDLLLRMTEAGIESTSSDFRGALAENAVMQALSANGLRTFYWMPPDSWGTRGEVDFVLQTGSLQVVPVEVKSSRNVTAKSLRTLVQKGRAPFAYRLSGNDFARSTVSGSDCELRSLPLYAAFCLGEGFVGK